MLSKGWHITLAGEGKTANLLSTEFPAIQILPLRGYRISYPKRGWLFIPTIMLQIPKMLSAIVNEHFWLRKKMRSHAWDIIVSDNRYGLFHKKATSIFISWAAWQMIYWHSYLSVSFNVSMHAGCPIQQTSIISRENYHTQKQFQTILNT
jgi:hypothetical protein